MDPVAASGRAAAPARPAPLPAAPPAAEVLAGYHAPGRRVLDKVIHHLDHHCTAFIGLSPFCTLATASPEGWPEVSPRGGEPGFVRVLDGGRLALPDRQGNNRVDSLRNLAVNPRAALMFVVPGIDETLRVYGRTSLLPADSLGIDLTEFGRKPLSVLVLEVERAYFQCSKAVMRSGLWNLESRVPRSVFPPLSQVLRDHCRDDTVPDEATLRAGLAAEL
ncbi:MSMEG_1061 family FMN-dependent PPOX-type flavoprotein [Blastococcus deserti]|uniref:MSMEG_1061 family FMN-dependent PPOX-type flavoprotein n=1 Tax=Blastococcus deserti TaxID=2259033 RepID=A0ABW4X8Z4_9ACTN